MGLHTPSAPWGLSLSRSLGTLCFVQWMTVRIHFCICQALAEPLMQQLYQVPVSKLFLASAIVSEFGNCIWDGSLGGTVSGRSFFSPCSTLCLCNSFHGYSVPPSKKNQHIHTLVFLLLEFHGFCKLYLEYSKFLG